MLRALLRRIPRFGFVTLFALMLLFVSAAGWLKFHLDLWREEEALFADLSKAGVNYSYGRHSGDIGASVAGPMPPQPRLWDPLVPFFSRIEDISFRDPAPRELLERAARLPYVRSVGGHGVLGTTPTEAVAAIAGFELDTLSVPAIPSQLSPMPNGEPLDDEEAEQALNRFADAFHADRPLPKRGTVHFATGAPARSMFSTRVDSMRFAAFDSGFGITTKRSHDTYLHEGGVYRQNSRLDDPALATEMVTREDPPLIVFDPRRWLSQNLRACGIESQFWATLRDPSNTRVERIDESRVRIDVAPIAVQYPATDSEDAYAVSMIARSDLDWELEACEFVGTRKTGPNTPKSLSPVPGVPYRGTLRREADWIVAQEFTTDWISGPFPPVAAGSSPNLFTIRHAGIAKYDFSADLDLSHVTPELFDAELLPRRRELPWLPWHRATFALSLGLLAFVGVRRFWKKRAAPRNHELTASASGGRQSPEVPSA